MSDAEQKALAAKMAAQPNAAPAGMQVKTKPTKDEEMIERMQKSANNPAEKEVFG